MSSGVVIFGSAVLILLLAGYWAQHFLPPPTPKLVGIDLGTTYSCIGVYEAVTGNVRVIPNSAGKSTIPSIVYFSETGEKVGYEALKEALFDSGNTIYDAKRFIGKYFRPEELKKFEKNYPFRIISRDGMANFLIGSVDNATAVTPEYVGSCIIKVLKATAERNLSLSISKAVMAVPAEFDELQRNMTKEAARLAGIEVLRIINEPTAAALAYGLHKKDNVNFVVVVDLGGGTSDVSLLFVQQGMFLTQAIAGNNFLGGQDFNQRLYEHLQMEIQKETGKQITHPDGIHALKLAVEEAKLNLTEMEWTLLRVPFDTLNYTFVENVTRRTFEEVNGDLFAKVLKLLDIVLQEGHIEREDVNEVVLVGGSTRIPKVRQMIEGYFGKPPNMGLDPELAVAHGVAIQAGIIGGMWPLTVSAVEIPSTLRKIHLQ